MTELQRLARTRDRHLRTAGAALAAVAALTACSPSNSTPANTPFTTLTGADPVITGNPGVDYSDLLRTALTGLANGYHFTSDVTVNGTRVLQATGDRLGTGSRLEITSNGATVQYVILPTASYAQPEGGDWELLDTPPAQADPINSLTAPTAVQPVNDNGATVRLRVTVLAALLGVAADGDADLDVTLTNGIVTTIEYSTPAANGTARVTTALSPVADPTPVTAPV